MSDPYEVVTWRDHRFDRVTVAAIKEVERLYGKRLTITQGSYNKGGVSQSAGTHDGGGTVDFGVTSDTARLVRTLRTVGFAAWHRTPDQGPWGAHVHAVLIGNTKLAPVATRQVTAYREGRDGLASNRVDPTWRPDPIPVFVYPEEAMAALLEDLRATAKSHGVSLVYAARICLFGASSSNTGGRLARIKSARVILKGMK